MVDTRILGGIAVATISLACIIVGLLYPNSVTPMTILPPIITSLVSINRERGKIPAIFLAFACFWALICFILGMTTTIISISGHFKIVFRNNVAMLSGIEIPYELFGLVTFLFFLELFFYDIFNLKNTKEDPSFDRGADRVII